MAAPESGRGIFAPRARINPPPPASGCVPGRLALHQPLRIIYPPTLLPPPPSRYFLSSWRLSGFPPLPLRDPPPPPSSEGIISPLLCRIIPPVRCPSPLPPRLCPSAASPLRDYLLSLRGDSSSLDLCPGLSLLIFLPRKSSLPFRLPLTGERGENVVVIGWAGVSSSAVICLVSVLVLRASGCR